MTCGRDAQDKGGGNRQDGCGKGFNWDRAKPYKKGDDLSNLPKALRDVDLGRSRDTLHFYTADDRSEMNALRCQSCAEVIRGPRFSCVHCRTGLELCDECCFRTVQGDLMPESHEITHVFSIYLEESDLGGEGPSPEEFLAGREPRPVVLGPPPSAESPQPPTPRTDSFFRTIFTELLYGAKK